MADYYAYKGDDNLGEEPLGGDNKTLWRDLKTDQGAKNRAEKLWPTGFRLFRFTDWYNDATFVEVP